MTTFDAFMLIPSSCAKKRAERHMKIQLPLRAKDDFHPRFLTCLVCLQLFNNQQAIIINDQIDDLYQTKLSDSFSFQWKNNMHYQQKVKMCIFVFRGDIEWAIWYHFYSRWEKLSLSHVLGGPNTDKNGRKQYPIKYSGFFLVVMKYACEWDKDQQMERDADGVC